MLIDEVDGFLQDRRGAHRSWEVTGVNEMLTQMESFSGVFIASTNLIKGLDQAALRRFDLKLKFDFMLENQAWLLFKSTCAEMKLGVPHRKLAPSLRRLGNITPGDFAAVARRHRFKPVLSADELLVALADECRLKEDSGRAIGFI